jgi:hypothetical protein
LFSHEPCATPRVLIQQRGVYHKHTGHEGATSIKESPPNSMRPFKVIHLHKLQN